MKERIPDLAGVNLEGLADDLTRPFTLDRKSRTLNQLYHTLAIVSPIITDQMTDYPHGIGFFFGGVLPGLL